jgi:hypothetical protein
MFDLFLVHFGSKLYYALFLINLQVWFELKIAQAMYELTLLFKLQESTLPTYKS